MYVCWINWHIKWHPKILCAIITGSRSLIMMYSVVEKVGGAILPLDPVCCQS